MVIGFTPDERRFPINPIVKYVAIILIALFVIIIPLPFILDKVKL